MHNKISTTDFSNRNLTPDELQSKTIDLLRFPLAIMVMFIHMNTNVINLLEADFGLLSGHGFYNVVGITFSHVLTHVAVPTFFLISGFLFFLNFPKWSWDGYKKKLHSRVKTLLIPYILWNVLPILLAILGMLGIVVLKGKPIEGLIDYISKYDWHVFYDYYDWGSTRVNWLGENLRMTGPYDLPLWFLRDLIVVTILSPVIYFAVRRLKIFVIGILFFAYISRIWTLLPGFQISAFFYFTTGAYFALNKINIVQFSNKYRFLIVPMCFVLLIPTVIFDGVNTIIGQNVYPLFVCTGVFTAFIIASNCITKLNVLPNKLLVSSCFFIYAIHGVGIPLIGTPLSFICRALHKVIPGNSGIEEGLCYLVSPFLTAFVCIVVLTMARRVLPKTTLLFSGNK